MRGRSALVLAAAGLLVLTLGGCGLLGAQSTSDGAGAPVTEASDAAGPSAAPTTSLVPLQSAAPAPSAGPTRALPPAASAGGLCVGLNYDLVSKAVGVRFEVAAASGTVGREQVCVLQRMGASLPDLTLSMTPTVADAESFKLDFQPKTAKELSGLGLAAYTQVAGGGQAGRPTAEVGWLGKKKLFTLTYSGERTTSATTLQKVIPGLVSLAKSLPK